MNRIVLYEGVSGMEAMSALAAFHAAGLPAELVADEALVPTREGARIVPARLGIERDAAAPDALVLPGGDVAKARADPAIARALRARRGLWTLASGEAVDLVASTGLGEGRRVATRPGPRLVADGRLLTCTGGDAIVDLALHYAMRTLGDDPARRAAHVLGRDYEVYAVGAAD